MGPRAELKISTGINYPAGLARVNGTQGVSGRVLRLQEDESFDPLDHSQ